MGLTVIFSSLLGIIFGFVMPMIPYAYTKYTAIAIMAALDSIIGAINSQIQNKYSMSIFITGFFSNMFIAIAFTMVGESLGVDIFVAAIVVFIFRIFNNLSAIRREILSGLDAKKNNK